MGRKRTNPGVSEDASSDAIDKLSIRQRAFVKALTSPDSPTFGNQTQSYSVAYNQADRDAASVHGSRVVGISSVATAIRDEIERQGLGAEVRIGSIRDIIHGRHKARSTTTSKRNDDGTVETTTETTPRAQDVLKAVALLDRLDGTDSARQAEARAKADALRELTRSIMRRMDKRTADRSVGAQERAGEAGGGGGGLGSPIT